MRRNSLTVIAALFFASCVPNLVAQDKPPAKTSEKPQSSESRDDEIRLMRVSLKVQVVFAEYEGDKKLKSLPYTFLVTTRTKNARPGDARVRMGTRVPIYTGGSQNGGSVSYLDVGTNIDCTAETVSQSEFQIFLSLERSWVDGDVPVPVQGVAPSQEGGVARPPQFRDPVIRQYRADLAPVLKDGQSFETSIATDPLSGRTMKIEVSLSTIK
jgi:hypothetical protein